MSSTSKECAAEFMGTFLLVFFGVGSVHTAVLTGAQVGLWQVAIVWGIGIGLAIYAFGSTSGAHFNPAVTAAFTLFRKFPVRKAPAYLASQLSGAFVSAALLYFLFSGALAHFEAAHGIIRGAAGSELSGMAYGEYFPHPGMAAALGWAADVVPFHLAMAAEFIGAALLVFFIFAMTDNANIGGPGKRLTPIFIGLGVSILISILAPISQGGFNPARDFGPRLVAMLAGWGEVAIPGPRGGFFLVYIFSPLLGAVAGGGAHTVFTALASAKRAEQTGDLPQPDYERTNPMPAPHLILVGGFLGAGKTTLLEKAAAHLERRGMKVGLITNDQAPDLVDTALLALSRDNVREVSGSCFCCNFPGFAAAVRTLQADGCSVILAEPVGSCTDLSATILQPLKDLHPDLILAPFTVLLDPRKALEALGKAPSGIHPDAMYILRLQLAEADRILLNKTDLLSEKECADLVAGIRSEYPHAELRTVSARNDDGVEAWLDAAVSPAKGRAGLRIIDVDYDRYANGEAVLGWLNLSATPVWRELVGAPAFMTAFFEELRADFKARGIAVGHVKMLCPFPDEVYVGNMISVDGEISIRKRETSDRDAAGDNFIINARVECAPDELEGIVANALDKAGKGHIGFTQKSGHCLKPGRPNPTHRYARVI